MNPSGSKPPRLTIRSGRPIPAVIASVVLTACGGLGLWAAVWVLSGQGPLEDFPLYSSASQVSWGSALFAVLSAVVLVVGIMVVLTAVLPGRSMLARQALRPDAQEDSISSAVTTRGLSRIAVSEAERLDGSLAASAKASHRRIRIAVKTVARDRDAVRRVIHSSIQQRLDALDLRRQPKIMVTVNTKESR